MGRVRYAVAYFHTLEPAARRERLEMWLLKPDLVGRIRRFLRSSRPRRNSAPSRSNRSQDLDYQPVDTWTDATNRNFEEVRRILRQAGIDHAAIDDEAATRRQVAVAHSDKLRVIRAFEEFSTSDGELIGVPWTHEVRWSGARRSRLSLTAYVTRRRLEMSTSLVWSGRMRAGTKGRVFGQDYGTVISFWAPEVGRDGVRKLSSSTPNRWASVVPAGEHESLETTMDRALTHRAAIDDVQFPVDLVCLWVDGGDQAWLERRAARLGDRSHGLSADATNPHLFRDHHELRFALRSVVENAPFINHVYLVTDRQVPHWLDQSAEGITVVDHSEIFPCEALPVFNSNAIDTRLHHIPNLSEHFLVTNDDMLFSSPVVPKDFFTSAGQTKVFLSKARIPLGPPVSGEPGVDSAAKTNRSLLEARYGRTIAHKFKHIMIPQRRSVRERVAAAYSDAVDSTTRHPFRDMNDVSFSHLCLYDGLHNGDSVISALTYDYVSLGDPKFDDRLGRLERNPSIAKVVCLNDADTSIVVDTHGRSVGVLGVDQQRRDERLALFLERVFPTPCRWELGGHASEPTTTEETP